jgi:hypothetical protein
MNVKDTWLAFDVVVVVGSGGFTKTIKLSG